VFFVVSPEIRKSIFSIYFTKKLKKLRKNIDIFFLNHYFVLTILKSVTDSKEPLIF